MEAEKCRKGECMEDVRTALLTAKSQATAVLIRDNSIEQEVTEITKAETRSETGLSTSRLFTEWGCPISALFPLMP
jgi:hypothetical protein